ncbi:MupA/Atu3671 family FMN-dependent luciferase-like monooxygenase [Paracoccus liaowanqingii]|uniref:MupA/Atu3671 family FMN-dependent luciferase-like monooxygenase n=1 Tax=Paracoccus liaowanqingii TaxID=2560053 RepID=UPI001E566B09|nr:MupA/Atu3671 family FMN-dependent luciferase-like monooxygenase [Paracoccus liaowanqingii]
MTQLDIALIGNASLTLEAARLLTARGHRVVSFTVEDPALAEAARGLDLAVGPVAPCDYLLSVAHLTVIAPEVLAQARRGAVNFHDGPLPERAGLNAPIWALIEGASAHAITWHRIGGGVDEGPVLLRVPVEIALGETALTLNARCWEAALRSLPDLAAMLERGEDAGTAQPHAPTRRHMRIDRPQGAAVLDFAQGADAIAQLVRALDHGPYWNPMLRPRVALLQGLLLVGQADPAPRPDAPAAPGTVLRAGADELLVACGDGRAIALSGLTGMDGQPRPHGLSVGDRLPVGTATPDLDAAIRRAARDEPFWRARMARLAPLVLPELTASDAAPDWQAARLVLPQPQEAGRVLAALVGALMRMTGSTAFDIGLAPSLPEGVRDHMHGFRPLAVDADDQTLAALAETLTRDLAALSARGPILADLIARAPELGRPGTPGLVVARDPADVPQGAAICVDLPDGPQAQIALWWDRARLPQGAWQAILDLAETLAAADPALPLAKAPTLRDGRAATVAVNDATAGDAPATIAAAFAAQVAASPDATALVFRGETLSYADLDRRATALARQLAAMGVGPDRPVGLFAPRGIGLVVGALAILKAGGAYVPLDPEYPAERLEHYIADSGAQVVLADPRIAGDLPPHQAQVLMLDAVGQGSDPTPAGAADLAYLIYTSGSTGTPKGVMVEHRNAINFFAGMDTALQSPQPGTWLAVTSLSFDISVLEIFWTLTRGWKVVIAGDLLGGAEAPDGARAGTEMSLFYWGNDDGAGPRKYELLLEGAKFADRHGFAAVWTPERHFHAFGGPYPNPAVTGAAVAAVTKTIAVRAGSCVAPLHHPARIAEEWAVIDNLTNGRAGLAIASGWQPDDFVLRPENTPPANKAAMLTVIDQLRRLWRGEAVEFPRADGTPFAVVSQPRPVSKELPIWVTTAGNPATWQEAGRIGANVLTHLLGQSMADIAARIPEYHAALREAGHDPADFSVTLMLHSYLADTREQSMEVAREPMKDYLRAAAALVKQYAWAFPAFKRPAGVSDPMAIDLSTLDEGEMEGILDFAFQRYFNDSGLFGTVDEAAARVAELKAIGVTEIACLIDYGIAPAQVLTGLEYLARLHDRVNPASEGDYGIAAQIARHKVTHLQATPSMARLLLEDAASRAALSQLQLICLGGEALSPGLLADLRAASPARIMNMYGPTETTIWSATADLGHAGDQVWLGDPIAATSLHLRDPSGDPVGDGVAGELWIGGAGVTRGYFAREAQTAAAFPETPEGRLYRTGDLCRRDSAGRLRFLGRVDQQVKLRGYRIELGEIEARLARLPGIAEVAVVAQAQVSGERQLIGFVTGAADLDPAGLRAALSRDLPDFMVPLRIHVLPAMPLTPNAKIERKALASAAPAPAPRPVPATVVAPAPAAATNGAVPAPVAPAPAGSVDAADLQDRIGQLMARILGLPAVQPGDNFFDLGGHSLLAVQLHRAIRDELGVARSSITDIFRFPVMGNLAAHLAGTRQAAAPAAPAAAPTPVAAPADAPAPAAATDLMAARRALRARMRPQGTGQ